MTCLALTLLLSSLTQDLALTHLMWLNQGLAQPGKRLWNFEFTPKENFIFLLLFIVMSDSKYFPTPGQDVFFAPALPLPISP